MHDIYALKDMAIEELEEYGRRGEFSRNELPTIDTLAHLAKNLCKIIAMCEEETGYSYGTRMTMRGNYSGRDHYSDLGSYSSRYPYYGDYSMARGRGARRDSMGRYSGDDDWMMDTLEELKEKAPNDNMRMEFQEFIERMKRTK